MPVPPPDQSTPDPPGIFSTYQTPAIPPSEIAPSSGGRSLSCPTEGASHEAPRRVTDTEYFFNLFDHDTYDLDIRLRPLELPPVSDESNETPCGPLAWKFDFSWKEEELLFAGERLSIAQTPGPFTTASRAVVGGSSAASASRYTVQESIASSGTVGSHGLLRAVHREEEIAMVISERRDYFVGLLEDHYWRTHPPQRSDKRNSSQRHSGISTSSRSGTNHGSSASRTSREPGSSKKGKGVSDGSAGDEEDDDNGTPPTSRATESKEETPYYACPFLKWNPHKFAGCMLRFRTISHMIAHLEEKHSPLRCPQCNGIFDSKNKMKMHTAKGCIVPSNLSARPGITTITDQQRGLIKTRPRKYQFNCPEQRWRSIFKILFPDSPQPQSVYLEGQENELVADLVSFLETEGRIQLRRLQEERAKEDHLAYAYESREQQVDSIFQEFIPRLARQLKARMTQDEECISHTQGIQSSNPRPLGAAPSGPKADCQSFTRLQPIPEEPSGSTTPSTVEIGPWPTSLFNGVGSQLSVPGNENLDAHDYNHAQPIDDALDLTQFSSFPTNVDYHNIDLALQEKLVDDFNSNIPLFDVQNTSDFNGLIPNGTVNEQHFYMDMLLGQSGNDGLEDCDFFLERSDTGLGI